MMRSYVMAVALTFGSIAWAGEPVDNPWKLIWSDEFNGAAVDRHKWDFDLGNGFYSYDASTWVSGWGNEEQQYYTDSPRNVFVRDGHLHIRALRESHDGFGYTSARLRSSGRDGSPLFNKRYGRFEVRAKFPVGQGIWPAVWLLPQQNTYGAWAASGEIDIVEARGQEPDRVQGSLHFGSRWPAHTHASATYEFPEGGRITDFHVYAVEWEPGAVRWYVNDDRYATQTFWWSSSKTADNRGMWPASEEDLNPWPAPFDQPFYILINLAVGGYFPGPPDATTPFPAELVVDYIRVYERTDGYGRLPPRGDGELPFPRTGH